MFKKLVAVPCECILLATFCWSTITMKQLCNCHQQKSQQTNEQTKVVQEIVSPESSKLNHKKQGEKQRDQRKTMRSNAVFFRKNKKNENGFITLFVNRSYQSMDCVIKWGNRFINSTSNLFICLKMFIMQRRKNRNEMK